MKKLLYIIFLCSMVLLSNGYNATSEVIKIDTNNREQDLYVFTQYCPKYEVQSAHTKAK